MSEPSSRGGTAPPDRHRRSEPRRRDRRGALRDEGYDGRLLLIGAEDEPPYERPPLSKELLRGEATLEDALVRPASWYEEHDVDARFGTRAVQIDVGAREVVLAGGERLPFDRSS